MKSVFMTLVLLAAGESAFALPTPCETKSATRLEMIQLIAFSEALATQAGPRRDVAAIEVFALSNDGLHARVNVTFAGTNGNSEPATLKALVNCEAGGKVELE